MAVGNAKVQEECVAALIESIADGGACRAEKLRLKCGVTFDYIWRSVQHASLVERRTDRFTQVDDEAQALPMWTLGLFGHGGLLDVTSEARRPPLLVELSFANWSAGSILIWA